MQLYEIGVPVQGLLGHPDGMRLSIDAAGATIISLMSKPTVDEIANYKPGVPLRLSLCKLDGKVLFLLIKTGSEPWCDMPYNPYLSGAMPELQPVASGEGLAVVVMLVDTKTGAPVVIRMVGTPTDFTRELYDILSDMAAAPMDARLYEVMIARAMDKYTTDDLLRRAGKVYRV